MLIPETVICPDALPASECLLLLPGAVKGSAVDRAALMLPSADELIPDAPVQEIPSGDVPAAHLLAARSERLDAGDPAGVALLQKHLHEAIELGDALGVREMSFLALCVDTYDSRLFALMTVFFRVLMENRAEHPCLQRIRFFCRNRADAEWIARVYNFYYPGDRSERMTVPGE